MFWVFFESVFENLHLHLHQLGFPGFRALRRCQWRRKSIWTRCSSARTTVTCGTPISWAPFRPTLPIVALRFGVDHVSHTSSASELFTMICQGTPAVLGICPVVVGVEKVGAQNFALPPRFSYALETLLRQPGFCCKTSLTYRQHNVIIALLVSCSAFNKLPAYFPLLQ